MTDEILFIKQVEEEVLAMGLFLVDFNISKNKKITILVDSMKGITVDECAMLSRKISEKFENLTDEWSIEVSSPGISKPFKTVHQYLKNLGKQVEVTLINGKKVKATLLSVFEYGVEIEYLAESEVKKATKQTEMLRSILTFPEIRSTKEIVSFQI